MLLQDGKTAFMLAASNGQKEIVSILLTIEGIDVDAKDNVSTSLYC